jgi:hypothetical protein
MIDSHQTEYVKEFLARLCVTEEDKLNAKEIHETLRALFRVLEAGKHMVGKPPAHYSPNSRKSQMQDAIKPFIKVPDHSKMGNLG